MRDQHGESDTPRYNVWLSMRARCYRESDTNYVRYGARGIAVCDEWRASYIPFRDWAVASGYSQGLSLDRIDTYGDYSPDNCRWVTPKQNANNARHNHVVEAFGQQKTVKQWSEDPRCSVTYNAILYRLKRGWPAEAAIATPRTQKGGPS